MPVITFDFHNTLANCDPWFDLEIADLPRAVISRLGHPRMDDVDKAVLDTAYRKLRALVMTSGNEIDAYVSVRDIFEAHDISAEPDAIAVAIDELMVEALEALRPVDGAIETVRFLRSQGCHLGVVSSAVHHSFVEWAIRKMGLKDAFDSIVTSASAGYYKSSPEIFRQSLKELGAEPHRSVHVGDSLRWDVNGAMRAGIKAVWLRTGRVERQWTADTPPVVPELTLDSMIGAGPAIHEVAVKAEDVFNV